MPIKIAFISSKAYQKYISSIAQNIADIQIDFYIYEQPEEAVTIIEQLNPCDALVVGGLLPYQYIEHLIEDLPMPCLNIAQDETSVSTTLLAILTKNNLQLQDISIDVVKKIFVTNILKDMQFTEDFPKILLSTTEDLYTKHLAHYMSGQSKLIVTSVHHLYERFLKDDIPVMTMLDSTSATIQKIESLKSTVLLQKSNAIRAAAGIVKCHADDFSLFLQLVQMIHANYKRREDGNYELYATSGTLQSFLADARLQELITLFTKPFSIGFGYGQTFVEAMKHAEEAIHFAKNNEIYLLNEKSELSGPYPEKNNVLQLKLTTEKLIRMSEKTKLSALNLSKIMTFISERPSHEFSAQDLADYLLVSRRTAERTIQKLVAHQYIKIISSEMTYQKGRPRAIYTFLEFSTLNS